MALGDRVSPVHYDSDGHDTRIGADFGLTQAEGPNLTTPTRLSQEPVEVVVLPTSGRSRVSQEAVEAAMLPTSQKGLVSQYVVEVLTSVPHGGSYAFIIG